MDKEPEETEVANELATSFAPILEKKEEDEYINWKINKNVAYP
jgi:hypothetical protein